MHIKDNLGEAPNAVCSVYEEEGCAKLKDLYIQFYSGNISIGKKKRLFQLNKTSKTENKIYSLSEIMYK